MKKIDKPTEGYIKHNLKSVKLIFLKFKCQIEIPKNPLIG